MPQLLSPLHLPSIAVLMRFRVNISLVTLSCVLHMQGAATEEHPVTEELARIKKYMGKLKELGQGAVHEQQRLKVHCALPGVVR